MKKYLLVLLLIGCGDDLGWDKQPLKQDCEDVTIEETSEEDIINEDKDGQIEDGGEEVDVVEPSDGTTETDVFLDDSNDDDSNVDLDASSEETSEEVEIGEDVSPTWGDVVTDASEDVEETDIAEEVTEVVVSPPECVSNTDCDDQNNCTDDLCEGEKCLNLPNEVTCTDGDACTEGDLCVEGNCLPGQMISCDDNNPCTGDLCGIDEGCVNLPLEVTCTDGSACTLDDECVEGICMGYEAICEDDNLCTDDDCDPLVGCVNLPNAVTCTDGDPCTIDDYCGEGLCQSGALMSCLQEECVIWACQQGQCVGDFSTLDDIYCEDNNVCSDTSKCLDGSCLTFESKNCDDGNACTLDSCDNGCQTQNAPNGTPCAEGLCQDGVCQCASGYGCATPSFIYTNDVDAGMLGGMGGGVGPKMGCDSTDIIIGIGFDFSTNTQTATRTTVVCGKVSIKEDGTVETIQTNQQKSGGSGCFGWDPSVATPLTLCKSGWGVIGLQGKKPGGTLFNSVKLICGKLDVSGKPTGEQETLNVPGMNGSGSQQEILCPQNTIARFFETRAGCGQDALTMYCATPNPDCGEQELICKDQ